MSTDTAFEEIREELAAYNEEALLADGFEDALIGMVYRFCGSEGQVCVALYDRDKCIEILMRDMDWEAAEEYFEYNVSGAYVGPGTPAFAVIKRAM